MKGIERIHIGHREDDTNQAVSKGAGSSGGDRAARNAGERVVPEDSLAFLNEAAPAPQPRRTIAWRFSRNKSKQEKNFSQKPKDTRIESELVIDPVPGRASGMGLYDRIKPRPDDEPTRSTPRRAAGEPVVPGNARRTLPKLAKKVPRSMLKKKPRKLKLPELHNISTRLSKRRTITIGSVLAIAVLVAGGGVALKTLISDSASKTGVKGVSSVRNGKGVVDPSKLPFKVAKPTTQTNNTLHYDETKKVASYADKIGGQDVIISQQPLPPTFKGDPQGQLQTLATNIIATQAIPLNDGTAYVGSHTKGGAQTAVFVKGNALVFIASPTTFTPQVWAEYINSLK